MIYDCHSASLLANQGVLGFDNFEHCKYTPVPWCFNNCALQGTRGWLYQQSIFWGDERARAYSSPESVG